MDKRLVLAIIAVLVIILVFLLVVKVGYLFMVIIQLK